MHVIPGCSARPRSPPGAIYTYRKNSSDGELFVIFLPKGKTEPVGHKIHTHTAPQTGKNGPGYLIQPNHKMFLRFCTIIKHKIPHVLEYKQTILAI